MAQRLSIQPEQLIEIHSPATLQKVGEVVINSPAEVRAAVALAREAFKLWSKLDFKRRADVLLSARDLFLARREELIELLCAENGKPRLEAVVELTYACDVITFYAKQTKRFLAPQRHQAALAQN
jgi:acyl-CoA reductase-like NAD-dependent aldehyde dehydrogenase